MEIYVKISFIFIFSPVLLVFKHEFIRCVDFTASRSHLIFDTTLSYSCARFVVEIDENLALMAGFNTT